MGQSKFSNRVVATLLAILATLLWGSAYPFIKLGYEVFNVGVDDTGGKIAFGGARFLLAGLMVLIFHALKGGKGEKSGSLWTHLLLLGVVQTTIHYFLFYVGISYTTGAKSSILNSISVFFSAFIAHLLYPGDRLSWRKGVGIIIGFVAIVLVNLDANFEFSFRFKGEGLVMLTSLLTAVGAIYSKQLSQKVDPLFISGVQLAFGGLLLLLISLPLGFVLPEANLKGYLILLYLALVSAVAFSIWTTLLKHNRASSVTIFYFLIPIFGTLLSGLILEEDIFRVQYYLSLPIVAVGIYLVNRDK